MAYSAVDDIEDAYRATKGLLLPFELRRWLRLAVVVFFVSGLSGVTLNTGSVSNLPAPPGPGVSGPSIFDSLPAVLAIAGVVLLVALAFTLVGSLMEFVFVRIVERRDVRIRGPFGENSRNGVSLFLFRLLVGVVLLATVLFLAALVWGLGVAGAVIAVLLSPVIVVGVIGLYLLHRFTVDFVVPVMLVDDVGVVGGWQTFAPELRENAAEYGVYALVRIGLGIAFGVVVGIGFVAVGVLVGIPFAILAGVVLVVQYFVGLGPVFLFLAVVGIVLYAIAVTVVGVTVVQTPVSTYLRHYSLFVLADVSPAYDLVAEIRDDADEPSADD
ncbi:hypothetical protein GJ631_07145 [Natronomonas sp. CBA1123]|uniref:DUF7544 domain-containing protein n=1 Tax=Natronomonas sp. CBA1123 TaxID=2668070 RepID=UPI0012EA9011|nr:hypothetical protein [Natronomonas sp. CBA1123]MUV86353.1 hypothetical protein [Natronomonas sp. CBA1123]